MLAALFHLLWRFVLVLDFIVATVIMYLLAWLPRCCTRHWYPRLFQAWCRVFIRALDVDLKKHEKHHKSLPDQFILIGNHPSAFEDIGMNALFRVRFLAKHEVAKWWVVGRIGTAAGTLYVNRECKDSRQAASGMIQSVINEGDSIGVYPEGGCKGRRIHLPFRYGVFEIAIETNTPIVPVFLHYEAQESFEWQHQHLMTKLWMIATAQNRRVNYYVYDAIHPKDFKSKEAFCDHVQELYLNWQKRYLD